MATVPLPELGLIIETIDHEDVDVPGPQSYISAGDDDISVSEWLDGISNMSPKQRLNLWHKQKTYIFEHRNHSIPLFNTEYVEKDGVGANVVKKKQFGDLNRPVLERSKRFTELGHQMGKIISLQYIIDSNKNISEAVNQIPYDMSDFGVKKVKQFARSGKAGWVWTTEGPELPNKIPISSQTPYSGMIYFMYFLNPRDQEIPLYIGMSRKLGQDGQELGTGFAGFTRDTVFGRWGYGSSRHLGELSRAFFASAYNGSPKDKYKKWIDNLFVDRTRVLQRQVYIEMVPFFDRSIEDAEEKLIRLASKIFDKWLLNKEYTFNS